MEFFLVSAVVTALLVMVGVLINRNLRYKALATPNRWCAASVILVQAIVLVCDLFIEGRVYARLPFDMLLSAACLSLLTSPLVISSVRRIVTYVVISVEILMAFFYILCAAEVLHPPSEAAVKVLSDVVMIVYMCVFLYFIWYRVRDIHALMQSASVWAWLTFAVDVFYMLSIVVLTMFSHIFSPFPWIMAVLSLFMTGLLLAYMCRINSDSAFALLHRHERTIVESMKISSVDASVPGPGEEHMYKQVFERVQKFFEEEKPFLNGDLTINDVVAEVFSNKVYISRAISHFTGRNFCQYVNYHRVMYAMECYRSNPALKVSELWPMCGFNTIVSFNMAFRLFMNENPSDWCRKERMKMYRKRK